MKLPESGSGDSTQGEKPFDAEQLEALYQRGLHRYDHLPDGPYYIAPDSAPPIPAEMASRVDPDCIPRVMAEMVKAGTIDEHGRIIHSPERDQRLIDLGGESMRKTLQILREHE